MTLRVLLFAVLAASCRPQPPVPPATLPGDCSTAAGALERLGGCGQDMVTFPDRCQRATAAEVELGVRFPAGCITAAQSCEEFRACR